MNKIISLVLLVVFATISMIGCSSTGIESGVATVEETATTKTELSATEEMKLKDPFDIKVLGEIYQLYDTKKPAVNSSILELTTTDYLANFKNTARCIFESDDLLFVYLHCSNNSLTANSMTVTIVPHNENSTAYYGDFQSEYSTDDFLKSDSFDYYFALLYLDQGRYPPGYYDIVIMTNNKPIAVVMVKLFEPDGIGNAEQSPVTLQNTEIAMTKKGVSKTSTEATA